MRRLFAALVIAQTALAQAPDDFPAELEEEADPSFIQFQNPAFPSPAVAVVPVDRGPKIERADLAPYFAEGKLAEARAAFDAGNFTKAVALLDGQPEQGPIRFLRALSAHRSGDWQFSAKEFESLAASYAPLRDRCLVHAGWGYEQLRDWDSAIRVFAQVSGTSRLTPDARIGLSRAWRWKRDWKQAEAPIAQYLDRPPPPWGRNVGAEALLQLADLSAAKKDTKGEQAALLKLWSRHPMSKEAAKAEPRLGDLTKVPVDATVVRAEALIDAHRNLQGITMLEPIVADLKVPDPTACRAHFALGKGYRKQRQHAKALPELAMVRKCKDPELRARALFTLGFSQTISAQGLAASTYEALARGFPEHALADDALFFAADVHLRRGQKEEAMERLIDVVDKYPNGDFAADALFKLFWVARDENRLDEALEFLNEIEGRWAKNEDSYEVERAQFWRARVYEQQEKPVEAVVLYEAIATEHPATYYGLLARERVLMLDAAKGEKLNSAVKAALTAVDPFPIYAGPLGSDPQFASAVELLRMGFGEMVPMEILSIDRSTLPPDSLRLMVLMLSMAQQERSAHGMARLWLRRDLSGPITPERRAIWEIAYPNAFRDLVVTHSKSADELDPDLLQALMREESALDPKALSWAGALGLCQLMPATASGVAMQLKIKKPGQAQLLEPELNIQLGARYLSDLVIRQKGIKPFALASYNAGEGAVARWRRENGDTDLASWVELVPLQETRGYVKRVLRSYNTYKLLYAPGELAKTVAPPPVPGKPSKSG
ncbi:MAG: transglycosylase SLT domain-containing protein [Archangium sp.]